ncbi:hypothetical protein [Moorena sp. SIO3H5]|uniref:hypothetical protein n=1 Tax=Moorena sp. SIO3H5 TaxID=2607834 RepID=UPI0013B6FAD5|nr:hypothetical protein [Moorena sp. SIO3H5]NEO69499.1 hypothetical protein [Moorena sp. SIO3H5]
MLIYYNIKNSLELFPITPYSLLPTPYSLLPTPYSLLPAPYSLFNSLIRSQRVRSRFSSSAFVLK